MKHLLIILMVASLLTGCFMEDVADSIKDAFEPINCDDEIEDIQKKYSDYWVEVDTYESDGYYSYTYWYWCAGVSYTFTWGSDVGKCEQSRYTFDPICEDEPWK